MDFYIQWFAVVIEFIGLLLIAVELYSPRLCQYFKNTFEQTKPKVEASPTKWIIGFIATWVIVATILTLLNPWFGFVANIAFTVFTVVIISLLSISKIFVRLGVVIGKGNSVGGVGLVLALVGFSLEIVQLAAF
ncbi:MAG: hypothetical protein OQJ89_07545 [Kangiellaceae bacterium]|nr:hypothetical protein [Kangiellaceae bacterium]MCW8998802.1 hypothetical protein [Kangiellaceae bacterium]MCW9016801.1 hypothetical protein [Kangiellaceae bacterium]